MLIYKIFRVFAFWNVQHKELRLPVKIVPIFLACLASTLYLYLPISIKTFGDSSLTHLLLPFCSMLSGFFVVALTTISTVNHKTLDMILPEPAPKIMMRTRGRDDVVKLTMRLFLSYLFGYLTALTFSGILVMIFGEIFAPGLSYLVASLLPFWVLKILILLVNTIYVFFLFWIVISISIITLYGLYFLTERIYRSNS